MKLHAKVYALITFFFPDIEVQMVYTSLNVSEENSTVVLCVAMTAGALEKNVTVILQTQPITGM